MSPPPGPDCERRRDTFPAEPANAYSSLAFLAGAAVLAARAAGPQPGDAGSDRLAAASLAANGLGSFWYHARYGRASRWGHDWAIAALLWMLAVGGAGPRTRRRLEVAGLGATAAVHAALPDSSPIVHAVAITTFAVASARATDPDPGERQKRRRRRLVTTAALAAGGACYVAGRTGSPCCRPDRLLQPHAAWHVLAAVASTGLALDVADRRGRQGPRSDD